MNVSVIWSMLSAIFPWIFVYKKITVLGLEPMTADHVPRYWADETHQQVGMNSSS